MRRQKSQFRIVVQKQIRNSHSQLARRSALEFVFVLCQYTMFTFVLRHFTWNLSLAVFKAIKLTTATNNSGSSSGGGGGHVLLTGLLSVTHIRKASKRFAMQIFVISFKQQKISTICVRIFPKKKYKFSFDHDWGKRPMGKKCLAQKFRKNKSLV